LTPVRSEGLEPCRDRAPDYQVSRWSAKPASRKARACDRRGTDQIVHLGGTPSSPCRPPAHAFGLTLLVLAVGSVLIWAFESGVKGGDIHGYGDAVFFTAVQLLTISSAIANPLTTGGKVVDVALEMWAIFVVTGVAGSFASFFTSGDSS
jgi:hypothetical protein